MKISEIYYSIQENLPCRPALRFIRLTGCDLGAVTVIHMLCDGRDIYAEI
jgi:hypothetical protein